MTSNWTTRSFFTQNIFELNKARQYFAFEWKNRLIFSNLSTFTAYNNERNNHLFVGFNPTFSDRAYSMFFGLRSFRKRIFAVLSQNTRQNHPFRSTKEVMATEIGILRLRGRSWVIHHYVSRHSLPDTGNTNISYHSTYSHLYGAFLEHLEFL